MTISSKPQSLKYLRLGGKRGKYIPEIINQTRLLLQSSTILKIVLNLFKIKLLFLPLIWYKYGGVGF